MPKKNGSNKIYFLFLLILIIWLPGVFKLSNIKQIYLIYLFKTINSIAIIWLIQKIINLNKKITEKNEEIEKLNLIDHATGFYNLSYFYESLEREMLRSERQQYTFFVGIIELDQNKEITKYLGEIVEPSVLKDVVEIIENNIRKGVDTAFRYNENMFALILDDISNSGVKSVTERVLQDFVKLKKKSEFTKTNLYMGFMQYHSEWDIKIYIQKVYLALLEAKKSGNSNVVIF